ncbi:fibroblast growth factor receptor-like [Clytia hemisphaerica]
MESLEREMDYKVASYLLLSCILISHVHSNNLTNTINTTNETPTNPPTYTIPLILQNTTKLTPITITNEKITTKSMTTPITTTNNTTTKTTTTTATTTTTTTPTTTTTMRPCRRMKFINRIHQANPEVLTLVGSTFVIDCSVDHTGGPEPSVYWYKDDIPLQENSFRTFDEHRLNKTFRLRLENVDIPDNGKYKCTVDNVCSKSITNTVSIIVREQRSDVPIISTFEPVNATRLVGEELQLTCGADLEDGEFTPFIKWVRKTSENVTSHLNHTYNNTTSTTTTTTQPPFGIIQKKSDKIQNVQNVPKMNTVSYIEDDVRYTVTDLKFERTASSTLSLEDLKEEDSGVYTCVMSNLKGVVRKSSHVTINPSKYAFLQIEELFLM